MKNLIRLGDYAGIAASMLCLVHCVAAPLLVLAFPVLGLGGHDHAFHDMLLAAVTLPVLLALLPGYLAHRDPLVLPVGLAGLACFLAAVFFVGPRYGQGAETALAVASSVLLVGAHLRNHRGCKRCVAAGKDSRAAH